MEARENWSLTDWEDANDFMESEYGFGSKEYDTFMDISLDESEVDALKYAISKGYRR